MVVDTMVLVVASGLVFASVVVASLASYAPIKGRAGLYLQSRVNEAKFSLEDMFVVLSHHRLWFLHVIAPVVLGLVGLLVTRSWYGGAACAAVGLAVPKGLLRFLRFSRAKKFHGQLVDCLLVLSSCLRAGLSMMQSFNVIAEEMPSPINQEFGLLLKETRMGVTLDEAAAHLRQRMPSDDLNLFVTAILVARETGGDVTAIFTRLVETLRDRKKIRERIHTLTFMAKLQAVIMGCLPFAFSVAIYSIDPTHFGFFLTDPTGKLMLGGVVMVQLFGAYLFLRFSRSPL